MDAAEPTVWEAGLQKKDGAVGERERGGGGGGEGERQKQTDS